MTRAGVMGISARRIATAARTGQRTGGKTMAEYFEKEELCDWCLNTGPSYCDICVMNRHDLPAADVRPVPEGGIGEMSDGYHTFNGLYYQRMILFAALVKAYRDKAWKSRRHEDGELCFGGGWFVVGIDTPEGSYTYHYEDKDWDFFDCEELPTAKHWDGHTEKDVTRLLSLVRPAVTCADCKLLARIKKDCILASCDLDALVRCEDFYCANGEKREES